MKTRLSFCVEKSGENMAVKKIGALIALDGEKKFKQDVTSCNKTLSALKSELGLVKAQYDGQANSLEALSKKHEVLSKVLQEQEAKEEAVREGLKHAQEEYDKVGEGLKTLTRLQESHVQKIDELKTSYKSAQERLDLMTQSGNSSQKAMKKQEAVVQALAKELSDEQAALDEVNASIDKGNRNYQTAENRIKDWQTKLNTAQAQVIKANSELNRNATYMREAEQATDHCATSIDEFGERVEEAQDIAIDFGTILQTNLINSGLNAVKDASVEAVKSVTDMDAAQKQFQASTGATAAEMQSYKSVMNDIYANNFGEDINDVAEAMALVKQYTGEIDASKLQEMTENGLAMQDVFGMDLSETIRGVDSLVENMGLTSEEAFDLMAAGAQNGLNKSGELADNITEYSQLWGQAGFSAKEMFAILDNGLDSGAYNLDKVNDFVKEFSISLSDGRIEENLSSFSSETQEVFKSWKSGKATTKDVFRSVINDLAKTENKQEALTIASNTWSSLGEDNALKVITSLNDVNHTFDDVEGTMEDINKIKYDTLEGRFQALGRKFQTEIAEPIAEKALPMLEEGLDDLTENLDILVPALGGVATGFAVFKTAKKAIELCTIAQTTYTAATQGTTVATQILNAVCKANPFVLVASAVIGAGTALFAYAENAGEASKEVEILTESNQKVCDSANETADKVNDLTASYADNTGEIEAQGEYAKILADRIQNLAGEKDIDNEKTAVMQSYIAELNELVPGLNLAYDEQAKKLNMTNKEMSSYLDNSQKQLEVQAAEEYAAELIKKRTELKIQEIKIDNEANDIKEEQDELRKQEAENVNVLYDGLLALVRGKSDEYQSYKETTEALKENEAAAKNNQDAQDEVNAEMQAVSEQLKEYGIKWDSVTGAVENNTEKTQNNAAVQSEAASANGEAVQSIVDSYMGMQETVSGVLDSQMDMFEEFNAGTEISSEKLLENMQSQIDGVTNWADNMAVLADRGVNQGILEKLAEMGPQGSTYVQAFANMTDEQLQQANDMWTRSLDMKSGVDTSVQGMIEQYTTSINGGKEQVAAAMQSVGIDVSTGLGNGIRQGIEQGTLAVSELSTAVVNQSKTDLGVQSPSTVFAGIGQNVVQGLANGITGNEAQAMLSIQSVALKLINVASNTLNSASFFDVGNTVSAGIQEGIQNGSGGVITAMSTLGKETVSKAKSQLNKKAFEPIGASVSSGVAAGIQSGETKAERAMSKVVTGVESEGKKLGVSTLYNQGYDVSVGLANGISDGRSEVINAVAQLCYDAVIEAESDLDINSPSKVFERIGSYTAEGFGIGYQSKMQDVNQIIRDSMEIPNTRKQRNAGYQSTSAFPDRITIELPIYTGKSYTKTEIVDIALKGIGNRQRNNYSAKGVRVNAGI